MLEKGAKDKLGVIYTQFGSGEKNVKNCLTLLRNDKEGGDNVTTSKRGNSAEYLLAKLRRETLIISKLIRAATYHKINFLPIGGASSRRACACSLRSRLVY